MAFQFTAYGQQRADNESRKLGNILTIGSALVGHLETFKKRLEVLGSQAAQEGIILTECQLPPWRRPNRSRPTGRLIRSTLATWAPRTPNTWGPSREWVGSTSRPSMTPTAGWRRQKCTEKGHHRRRFTMTEWFLSLIRRVLSSNVSQPTGGRSTVSGRTQWQLNLVMRTH